MARLRLQRRKRGGDQVAQKEMEVGMTEAVVLTSEYDGILELVINRPEKLNALNDEVLDGLRAAVARLDACDELRVLLIRATGRYFCSGADLSAFDDAPDTTRGQATRTWFRQNVGGMQSLWQEMELVEKPIVVAHHAMCVGGGLEMSLSCDFRLAAASAGYWFPEMKMGMVPASGGISRLTRLCGIHWSKWMILANKPVDAQRALAMGLVHEVYPDETFEQEARDFCRTLAGFPCEVSALAKMSIEMAADLESANARQLERLVYSNLVASEEQREIRRQHLARILKK